MTDRLDHTDPHGPHGPARTRTYRTDRTDRTDPHGSARIARTARTARTTQTRTDPHRLLGIMDCTISCNTPPLCELQKDCLTSSSCISPTHVFTSTCWKNSMALAGSEATIYSKTRSVLPGILVALALRHTRARATRTSARTPIITDRKGEPIGTPSPKERGATLQAQGTAAARTLPPHGHRPPKGQYLRSRNRVCPIPAARETNFN